MDMMSYVAHAETQIRNTQARVTAPRVRVLAFLLGQTRSMTHHEIERQLGKKHPIDAVTLYRVLEWLVESELAHKVVGDDQVWRFSAGGKQHAHEHAHFQCAKCATVTCFTDVKLPRNIPLPAGFQGQEVNFMIKGLCPRCS
jgi:Fur family ferric uptake transcriptional regulator